MFTAPLRRFLEAGDGYSSRDVEWQPGLPYRCGGTAAAGCRVALITPLQLQRACVHVMFTWQSCRMHRCSPSF